MTGQIDRKQIVFKSGGVNLIGYLYRQVGVDEKLPAVVMGTGFGGTQDTPAFTANAQDFARAGFAAFTFDYRGFGESEGQPRQVVSIQDQLADFHAAIETARRQPGIDPEQIALWGTSLGGGHVVCVAAGDPRVAAVVAQIPFNGFPKQVEGRSSAQTRRLLGAMLDDALRGLFRRPPHYIPAVGSTGELAVMASPEAKHVIEGMQSATWKNQVAPRALFEMMRYKPGDCAAQLAMPVLVTIGAYDKETQGDMSSQLATGAQRGVLKSYPAAHFDFYREDFRRQVIADQIAFLREHLSVPNYATLNAADPITP